MANSINDMAPPNVYDLFRLMSDNRIMMIYQSEFDQEIVKSVLSMAEKKLVHDNVMETTRRKLFNVMMEALQNICKHQLKVSGISHHPFFMIGKSADSFNVITGNIIPNEKIETLRTRLDHINSLNADQLKEYYKEARLNSVISSVGGAGLGFIDMARKSGNKLLYRFYEINNDYSYFILNNKINNF